MAIIKNKYITSDGFVTEMESYVATILAPFENPYLTIQYQVPTSAPAFCTYFCSLTDTDGFG
jgi:hypothetical protein